ncbi:MAG: hypothetical protein ACE5HC_12790 [Candidatus Binatia bacterium]
MKRKKRNQTHHDPSRPSRCGNRRKWLLGIFLVLVVGGGALWWNGTSGIQDTSSVELMLEPAPRFSLPASTGGTVRLKDYLEKQEIALFFYMFAG